MTDTVTIDALVPADMARRAEHIGVRKAEMSLTTTFALAVLAGAFVALGAMASSIMSVDGSSMPYGVMRMFMGLLFCVALILIIVAGAELFTGNNLIVMAWASGKVSTRALLRNWLIVYVGNFVGSISTALLIFFTKQYTFHGGDVGLAALNIANPKVNLGFTQAIALGIMCNTMVCLAVWLTYSGRTTVDKIAAIIFPITAFVVANFEHCIANMYFIPIALFIKQFDSTFADGSGLDLVNLTWGHFFLNNLLPVTMGNIIGGAGMVALVYWFIYLRGRD